MKIALSLGRWTGQKPVPAVALADLYPTAAFPDWIRTWPDGMQEILHRDGTTQRVPAKIIDNLYVNHPDFEATGVGRHSPFFPFGRERAS